METTILIGIISISLTIIGIIIAIIIYYFQKKNKKIKANNKIKTDYQDGNNLIQTGGNRSIYHQAEQIVNIYGGEKGNGKVEMIKMKREEKKGYPKEKKKKKMISEDIFNRRIEVKHHNHRALSVFLHKGELLVGSAKEEGNYTFDILT